MARNEMVTLTPGAWTELTDAVGIPDLSSSDAAIGGNGARRLIRMWGEDITDAGLITATA